MLFLAAYTLNFFRLILDFDLKGFLQGWLEIVLEIVPTKVTYKGEKFNEEIESLTYDVLFWSHSFQFILLQLYLFVNTVLNVDIYKMIKDPFMPPRLRTRKYYIYMGLFTIIMLAIFMVQYLLDKYLGKPEDKVNNTIRLNIYLMLIVYSFEMILNVFVIFRILCLLQRKGMSPTTMKQFQRMYFFIWLVTIPFYLSSFLHEAQMANLWIFIGS